MYNVCKCTSVCARVCVPSTASLNRTLAAVDVYGKHNNMTCDIGKKNYYFIIC